MSKTTKLVTGIVVILLAIAGWIFAGQKSVSQEAVKIGALYAVSGPAAKYGEVSIQGIKDAIDFFKTKNSKANIELVIGDTKGDPKEGVTEATRMFSVDGIKFALVGLSGVSNAVGPVADQYSAMTITDAASFGITKGRSHLLQNFLPSLGDIPKLINGKAEWKKVVVVYINDDFGVINSNLVKNNVNSGREVLVIPFEKDAKEFRTEATKIAQFQPDVAVVLGSGPALNQVMADLSVQNITAPLVTYLACTLPGVLTDKRFSLEDEYSYEYPLGQNKEMLDYISSKGGSTNTFYTLAFENTLLLLNSATKSGGDVNKAIDLLKNKGISALFGEVKFNQDGVVSRDLVLTRVEGGKCERVSARY